MLNYIEFQKHLNNYLLLAFSFFITTSYFAITNFIVLLLVLSWITDFRFYKKIIFLKKQPFILIIILFLLYSLISIFWSGNFLLNGTLKKQLALLFLPILLTTRFSVGIFQKAELGFVFGIFCNIVLSIITIFSPNNIFFKTGHYDNALFAHGFIDHFEYSIFLCFGLFIIISFFLRYHNYRIQLICLFLIFLVALLNSYGRVGILSFFLFCPFFLYFKLKLKFINIFLSFFTIIVCSYTFFSPFQNRVLQTIDEVSLLYNGMSLEKKILQDAIYLNEKNSDYSTDYYINKIKADDFWVKSIMNKTPRYDTSLGKRYLYTVNSLALISDYWLFGIGSGGFSKAYYNNYNKLERNPHNNYLLILVEQGIIGLFIFVSIFLFQIKLFFVGKKNIYKFILPLLFLFIMFFDVYMLNQNTLYFFCLFTLILYHKDLLLDT